MSAIPALQGAPSQTQVPSLNPCTDSIEKADLVSREAFETLCRYFQQIEIGVQSAAPFPLNGRKLNLDNELLKNFPSSQISNLSRFLPQLESILIDGLNLLAKEAMKAFKVAQSLKPSNLVCMNFQGWSRNLAVQAGICFQNTSRQIFVNCDLEALPTRLLFLQARKINYLVFHGEELINDAFLIEVLGKCENLEILRLTDCPELTDRFLKEISVCKSLKQLLISDLQISDKGLKALSKENVPYLERLSLYQCDEITDRGVQAIQRKYPSLDLRVSDCQKVSGTYGQSQDESAPFTELGS